MSITYPDPNDMPITINTRTNDYCKRTSSYGNPNAKVYEIKSNQNISNSFGSDSYWLDCLFNGNIDSGVQIMGEDTFGNDILKDNRIIYTPNSVLQLWFKLPDSIKLTKIRMYNQNKITKFTVSQGASNDFTGGTEIAVIQSGRSSEWSD